MGYSQIDSDSTHCGRQGRSPFGGVSEVLAGVKFNDRIVLFWLGRDLQVGALQPGVQG